jgi:hypothetical protein
MNRTITSCDFFDAHRRAGNEKRRDASYPLHVMPGRSHGESDKMAVMTEAQSLRFMRTELDDLYAATRTFGLAGPEKYSAI